MRLKLSEGNDKLKKTSRILREMTGKRAKVLSFNLPAYATAAGFRTCPGAGECAAVCYADQGTYNFPSVKAVREDNTAVLRALYKDGGTDAVVTALVELLNGARFTHLRIHDSGDFFKRWYLDAWLQVMRAFPDRVFYAYTKSVPLFDGVELPPNFRLTYSYGGIYDAQIPKGAPVARIFVSHEEMNEAGFTDGNSDEMADACAIGGVRKIGLVYHGARPMTAEEKARFTIRAG